MTRGERGWFFGGLMFAFGGVLSLAVSIFGWVTVGFFVQDQTAVSNEVIKSKVNEAGGLSFQTGRVADEMAESNRIERLKYGIANPKRHSVPNQTGG